MIVLCKYFISLVIAAASLQSMILPAIGRCKISKCTDRFRSFSDFCLLQQQTIISELESHDSKQSLFKQDKWERKSADGNVAAHGITAVMERGEFLEKGAVSTTIATGMLSLERARSISSRKKILGGMAANGDRKTELSPESLAGTPYFASAISLVLHSKSPMVPTFRADIRYFELSNGYGWFGGGGDLTPYYLFDEDAAFFHKIYKTTCEKHDTAPDTNGVYPKMKTWCDDYFYLPAREEHRGVGGIFFDDLSGIASFKSDEQQEEVTTDINTSEMDKAMELTFDVCKTFMPSYLPIMNKRRNLPYTDAQRHWQLLRRGRYIEFNLLYDRGVKFGLFPGGRIEAVLVSCPPLVAWDYNHQPEPGSEEARLMAILKSPKQWC